MKRRLDASEFSVVAQFACDWPRKTGVSPVGMDRRDACLPKLSHYQIFVISFARVLSFPNWSLGTRRNFANASSRKKMGGENQFSSHLIFFRQINVQVGSPISGYFLPPLLPAFAFAPGLEPPDLLPALDADFLVAASFLAGAFFAGAFLVGIKNPPFHPQLRSLRN